MEQTKTIKQLCAFRKGILAADESIGTIGKRFSSISVENNLDNRINYRNLLFTASDIDKYISGIITFEETLFNQDLIKPLLDKGIIVGIKTDKGLISISETEEENITRGLDTLLDRSKEYYKAGARFAKWRCVIDIDIDKNYPSEKAIDINTNILAQYAKISLQAGLIPIVEPEVLMTNCPNIETSEQVTRKTLTALYDKMNKMGIDLTKTLLKPNMVRQTLLNGKTNYTDKELVDISRRTFNVLKETVPINVPGIMFLSGGMSENDSTVALDKINKLVNNASNHPSPLWRVSFSYGRALQQSALKAWLGQTDNLEKAQQKFIEKAQQNSLASMGLYQVI